VSIKNGVIQYVQSEVQKVIHVS